jgi:N-acetylglutamate synthase-like GNAT family acetyltransferase
VIILEKNKIITVDKSNISEHQPTCFLNPNNVGYQIKKEWLLDRFSEGMRIKLLYLESEKKPVGFIEYVPGEYAWRAVDAKDYMFIHCIWLSKNKYKSMGYGSQLLKECETDAIENGMYGVAAITSEGPFMAGKDLFLKNEFKSIASVKPSFELMIKQYKKGPEPKVKDWESQLSKYKGLHILYSKQCPWVIRFIDELDKFIKKEKLDIKLNITELKTAEHAQNAPSLYASFSLIYNGKLLADHYISNTRFKNIIRKELQ